MNTPISYLRIKTLTAPKTGLNAKGGVSYAVLRDAEGKDVYFCLLGNDGGGYHSQEAVSLSAIMRCLAGINTNVPIPASTFKSAFIGQSANNSGFLAAVLRNESLLAPNPDATHQHLLGDNFDEWRTRMLNARAEPFDLPSRKKEKPVAAIITNSADENPPEHRRSRKSHKSAAERRELPSANLDGGTDDRLA